MSGGLRVTVTGGAGFIGSNLVSWLLRHPAIGQVTVVDDCSTGSMSLLGSDLADTDFRRGSVLDAGLLDQAVARADAVVHLAALPSVPRSVLDPLASHHANATGTLQVLEAARRAGGPLVVAASSSSVYGAQPSLPKSEDSLAMPLSPYAVTKLATEAYLGAYHACYALPVLPLRFFNVYGPRQQAGHPYAAVVPTWIDAALSGSAVTVHGDGTQTRDLTCVDTVCQVITTAITDRVTSPWPVNLALGTRTSLLDLIDLLGDVLGSPLRVEHTEPRPGDVTHSQADASRLLGLFPDATAVPLREGLTRTLAWHRERRAAAGARSGQAGQRTAVGSHARTS
ncbi:NAD-dependent epimerase/dehydratase family protein [Streptomyces sp. NPDC002917]|uniref:NAD-dependent epimerase/dehydratase family protein n=1 Tax=Streptomyces sp. NPDC002917 TaxID=3364671 RepID=UPI0036C1BDE3